MVKMILFFVGIVFAILGLAEFLHGIKLCFASLKSRAVTYSVLFLTNDNPVQQLTYSAEQLLWNGRRYADYVIAVDSGINDKDAAACRFLAEKYNIIYCTAESFAADIAAYLPIKQV